VSYGRQITPATAAASQLVITNPAADGIYSFHDGSLKYGGPSLIFIAEATPIRATNVDFIVNK
jgi:hypothetical protein